MKRAWIALAMAAASVGVASAAQEKLTYEDLWRAATGGAHTLTDQGDYKMVDLGDTYYYFTEEGHYAHPGVIKRSLAEENGRFFVNMEGWSFAAEAGQPGFHRWLAEFDALNRQMIEALQQQQQ